MTVPDQTLTVATILKRYQSGLPIGGQKHPIYYDEDAVDIPRFKHLDLVDQQRIIAERKQTVNEAFSSFESAKQKAKEKALAEAAALAKQQQQGAGSEPAPTIGNPVSGK